jgi:hypothetical protein
MARWFLLAAILYLIVFLPACSQSRPSPLHVQGTVNVDGKPLDDGSITLFGADGGAPDEIPVKDGKFDGRATPGKKRVELRAFRMGKETKMGDTVMPATKENYLPPRLNTDSKLAAEVSATGIDPSKFEVTSD